MVRKPARKKTTATSKNKVGRKRQFSKKEAGDRQRQRSAIRSREISKTGRDIAPIDLTTINWERRLACKLDLKLFCETYLPRVFYLNWSSDQVRCIRKIEEVFLRGGMFSLAMPRGGGKTALCRASILWGTAFGHRRFPFFIGSHQPKAGQTLDFIKTYWFRNLELREDFPEVGYPVYRLENRFSLARGQVYLNEPTHIEWANESIRYPSLLLPEELAEPFLKHDKSFVTWLPQYEAFITKSAGITIATAGIDGSIRGEAEVHPITLEQPRPDLVLLDDIQKDQKAESPTACEKLIRLIDGAVQGLAGPGETIACLMPCTVIRPDDVSDVYLDRNRKPEWKGERCSMVLRWPAGITNSELSLDTTAGKLWNKYGEERIKSYRLYNDIRLATKFYKKNRKAMDKGFKVSWPERYEDTREISAQQHAFNLRLNNSLTFASEYQNQPRRTDEEGQAVMLTAEQLTEKVIKTLKRGTVPLGTQQLSAFIDVQNEILFWCVLATEVDFTGAVVDYGTWPPVSTLQFTKNQTEGWSRLTNAFFKKYPDFKHKAYKTQGGKGKTRAPLEAKIYHALSEAVEYLLSREFYRQDGSTMFIGKLGIDARWGKASDAIKRYCWECNRKEVVVCLGQFYPPTRKQLEEYTQTKGWLFEHQVNRDVKEVKWVYRPNAAYQLELLMDVNRLKTFLHARLASPPGSPGSISLFDGPPELHSLFANHVCNSQYPEPVTARGITKDLWQERIGRPDDDYLDCLVGCCALCSRQGAAIRSGNKERKVQVAKPRRKLSEVYADRKRRR